MQKDGPNKTFQLYKVVPGVVPNTVLNKKNKDKSWEYGYHEVYDIVIISKDGTLGEIYEVNHVKIGLPLAGDVYSRSKKKEEQYWERHELPKSLSKIKSIFQWNAAPNDFKSNFVDYIEREFDRREYGFWFKNNGKDTYITGSNYMYLQWSEIDIGYPDFREANRIFWIFWEACVADSRCFGICYVKIRRSGFSFMSSSEAVNIGTSRKKSKIGILSKTGPDAKEMFVNKVVPISTSYPFFFKPIQDGMDRPRTEILYRLPAKKITRKSIYEIEDEEEEEGLETTIDWKNTADNSYDGQKLAFLCHDESGKWEKPDNIINNWKVTKTCLKLGRRIIGKCMMGSTVNPLAKGGANFQSIFDDSNPKKRNANGQTKSGLYALFIPTEWNLEGFIDMYGMPVMENPEEPVMGIDGEMIKQGAIEFWKNEEEGLKSDPDALNEFYRQFPRTVAHAFRDDSKESLFDLTKIYAQIDYNDSILKDHFLTRGKFEWMNGERFSRVIFVPDPRGRFLVSWVPPVHLQNRVEMRNGLWHPMNEHIGAFGCDSYDISGTVDGQGSKGSLHGLTKFSMEEAPANQFFLEYIARPPMAEIFFEDVLMAIWFYGMPILAENNKPRLLYHLKNNNCRPFSMNRPDKPLMKLSKTEKELGGIPNNSEDVKQTHATGIESYINKYVGFDVTGKYRDPDEIGEMYFNRTLHDWSKFNIANRTKHDASISSGLAIMANNKHMFTPEKKQSKISIKFATYSQRGYNSELIES